MIKIDNLNKTFGHHQVLKNILVDFPANKTTVLLGPSGSGKSTLLRSLNFLGRPESGIYNFDNLKIDFANKISARNILEIRRKTGMVFQGFNLFPHLSISQNITAGSIHVMKVDKDKAILQAQQLLKKVGLAGKENDYPNQLSGG